MGPFVCVGCEVTGIAMPFVTVIMWNEICIVLLLWIAIIMGEESAPICKIAATSLNRRVVVIGDVHGAFEEMSKILIESKITAGPLCEWLEQEIDTTVIQIGGYCVNYSCPQHFISLDRYSRSR